MDEHYYTRLEMYQKRKEYELDNLVKCIKVLESKMRFIEYVIDEKIEVYKKSKVSIINALETHKFPFYENNCIIDYHNDTNKIITTKYNYLLNMPIHSFTLEKVNELQTEIDQKKNDHDTLESKDIKTIWREELDDFEQMYKKM